MQDIYNKVKGRALGVAEYLIPILKFSKFLETGVLTPDEFEAAGDHLVHCCPTWRWDAGDSASTRDYLPKEKQFLITRNVPCYKRVSQMNFTGNEEMISIWKEGEKDWVTTASEETSASKITSQVEALTLTDKPSSPKASAEAGAAKAAVDDDNNDDGEVYDMDEYVESGLLEEEDQCIYEAPPDSAEAADAEDGIVATRTYDLHITYDKFYQTPRLWITGYDEDRTPLSVEAMYEDFSQDHANKTITVETHPHLAPCSPPIASVHPCKHAETMKRLCHQVTEEGGELQVHLYLIVFLKFMQAIIPTIEYDFTKNICLD